MINWYKDSKLEIFFDSIPAIGVRYILPSHTEQEKTSIKKYPFVNKIELNIFVNDLRKNKNYTFTIPKGYCFDGASVPRFFWRIIGSNTDNKFLVAAMVHDYMCENHDCVGADRKLSTELFNSLLIVGGVGKFKRYLMKNSVDVFQKMFCKW